jgi:hypothetical protein
MGFVIFKDGRPGDCIMPLKGPLEKTKMHCTLLEGTALSHFEYHLRKSLDAEDVDLPDSDLCEILI